MSAEQRARVSVVIPCRNGERDLPAQLTALAAQEWDGRWEVIVADNGSADRTVEVAKTFSDRLPVRVVDASGRAGQWYARNRGVAASEGDLVLFLDADDVVAPGYLAAMVRALQDHDAVAARLECSSLNPGWVGNTKDPVQTDGLGNTFGFLPVAAGGSLGLRRSAFDAVGGFSGEYGVAEDIDLCWRLQQAGYGLHFVPGAVIRYRFRDDLRHIYRQAVGYGMAGPLLYLGHRAAGMPRSSARRVLRGWAGTIRLLLTARDRASLGRGLAAVGVRIGRIRACARHRVVYL